MRCKELSLDDVRRLLIGCTVFGTGGGGELTEGWDFIEHAHALGKRFLLANIDDVSDDTLLCTPYLLGALDTLETINNPEFSAMPRTQNIPILATLQKAQSFMGRHIEGAICCELGGSNTAVALFIAAMNEGYVIDADPAGRAVPEITHSTYYLDGLAASPAIASNIFGETYVIENIVDDMRAESVIRAISGVSNNDLSVIDHIMPASTLRHSLIKGTLSMALKAGQALEKAIQNKQDIAQALAIACNGKVLCRGTVNTSHFVSNEGFTTGTICIDVKDINSMVSQSAETCEIEVKNENMLVKIDGEIVVTIPELITCIDLTNQCVLTNPNIPNHAQVAVLILPAPHAFTSEKGLSVFGPEYLDLPQAYQSFLNRTD